MERSKKDCFVRNLQRIMDEKGILQRDIAKGINVSEPTVSSWILGKYFPKIDRVQDIANFLGVSMNELLSSPEEKAFDTRSVPVQGCRPVIGIASAGKGVIADEDIIGWETVDKVYDTEEYFYLAVQGDSMSPKIDDGDLVLVKRMVSVDSGSVGVFIVDGETGYVKKVEYDMAHITLISFNPYYPPMTFSGHDVLRVSVVGKVIELKRRFG